MAYKIEKFGDHAERATFSKIKNTLALTDLLEIQKKSYQRFLEEGIKEVFDDLFPVESFTGNISLELGDYYFEEPRYTVKEAKERMVNYAAPLKVQARVFIHETGEVKEQEIFLGDLPLMTEAGTFIINGAERVIVSQLVRSPSVYYKKEIDKNGRNIISGEIIPNKGTWLEYELDARDIFYVRIDRTRKVTITAFLRALGLSSNEDILAAFGEDQYLLNTLEKYTYRSLIICSIVTTLADITSIMIAKYQNMPWLSVFFSKIYLWGFVTWLIIFTFYMVIITSSRNKDGIFLSRKNEDTTYFLKLLKRVMIINVIAIALIL